MCIRVRIIGAVGVAFVSLNFEPGAVGLSPSGVRFGRHARANWAAWQDIEAPGSGLFGLVVRRKSARGVLRLNYFLSPSQVRAMLVFPGSPKWSISSEVQSQLDLAESRPLVFGPDRSR